MKKWFPVALLCGFAFAGEVPRPTDTPALDKAIAEAEDAIVIKCAQLSQIVYLQDMSCRVCLMDGPLTMAFICVVREH